jgi:hypothetical protein
MSARGLVWSYKALVRADTQVGPYRGNADKKMAGMTFFYDNR